LVIVGEFIVAHRRVNSDDRRLANGRPAAVGTLPVAIALRSDNFNGDKFRPILRYSSKQYSHNMNYSYMHPVTYS
jgi:hypothetical protein